MESSEKDNIHVFRVNRETPVRDLTSAATGSKSRTSLSGGTKRLICEDHIQNPRSTQEELATKYGCKRTTIAKIIKGKDRWLSIDSDVTAKRFRQRTSRYPVIEEALLVWIQKEQQDCTVITDQKLQAQARLYAQTFDNAGQDFKASSSWLSKFKERYMNGTSPLEETTPENNETPPEKEEEWRYPNGEQTPLPEEPLLQDTSKDQARQHLEAVLSYYTSKNQTSSMSAQLVRLVLEKDF